MSDFNIVNDWLLTNVVSTSKASDITPELMLELQTMADEENETLSKRAFNTLLNYQRADGLRALATIRLNSHNPNTDDYMENAFSIVLLKRDPHSTDGIFVIIQIVPEHYVLKTIIRATKEYAATDVTHTFMSLFESSQTKPYMITGTCNGTEQNRLFANKAKYDKKEKIDPHLEPGNNDPFTITLPNGDIVEP